MEKDYDFTTNERLFPYSVRLEIFEGPLDLLLFLVRKNELDIYNIPIAFVVDQYLEYLELMKILDLEVAGEFLSIAATLIRIKASTLLPHPSATEEEFEEDSKEALFSALLEYKKYKEMASLLKEKEEEQSLCFPRSDFSFLEIYPPDENWAEVNLYDLLSAFKDILDRSSKETIHTVVAENITLEQRIAHILEFLNGKEKVSFFELFMDNPKRLVIVVTFMAILELIRLNKIKILQRKSFSQIWVYAEHLDDNILEKKEVEKV